MARNYSAEYERANELAQERGFDSYSDQRAWIADVRDQFDMTADEMNFDDALTIAQFEQNYTPGDMTFDELRDWWEDNMDDRMDLDDPDDPFYDFLDALSGEGS